MALFFDARWFDERLAERGLSRAILAAAAGLDEAALALVFKDQRELTSAQVKVFAEMLGATPTEVAEHAGVATPHRAAPSSGVEARLAAIEARLAAIEGLLRSRQ